jgi:hypothetical protein
MAVNDGDPFEERVADEEILVIHRAGGSGDDPGSSRTR